MKRDITIDFLRTIACLLILNFHFEMLYPDKLSFLSFGGDLGNNIFFMLSGYTLYRKISSIELNEFNTFIFSRLLKLLPSTLLILVISIYSKTVIFYDLKTAITYLFCPGHFWFVVYLVYFYILLFFQTKLIKKKNNIYIILVLLAAHLIIDNVHIERFAIGYISMICGYYLNESKLKVKNIYLLLSLMLYFALKMLLKINIYHNIIHLLVGISTIFVSFSLSKLTIDNKQLGAILSRKPIERIINFIAPCTLEIYLISFVNNWAIVKWFKEAFVFPISYVLCGISIILLSNCLNKINQKIWFRK